MPGCVVAVAAVAPSRRDQVCCLPDRPTARPAVEGKKGAPFSAFKRPPLAQWYHHHRPCAACQQHTEKKEGISNCKAERKRSSHSFNVREAEAGRQKKKKRIANASGEMKKVCLLPAEMPRRKKRREGSFLCCFPLVFRWRRRFYGPAVKDAAKLLLLGEAGRRTRRRSVGIHCQASVGISAPLSQAQSSPSSSCLLLLGYPRK